MSKADAVSDKCCQYLGNILASLAQNSAIMRKSFGFENLYVFV